MSNRDEGRYRSSGIEDEARKLASFEHGQMYVAPAASAS
jgi:hypothetical protein